MKRFDSNHLIPSRQNGCYTFKRNLFLQHESQFSQRIGPLQISTWVSPFSRRQPTPCGGGVPKGRAHMALTVTWSSSRCSLSIRSSAEAEHSWLKGKSKMENPDTQPAGNCQTKSSQVSFATCRRFLGSSMPPTEDEQLEFPFIFTPTVSSPHWRWSLARSLSWIVLFEKLLSHFVWGGSIFRTTDRSQSIWLV